MMIPYSGKFGPKLYGRTKPWPWGYKAYAMCSSDGVVHSTHLHSGAFPAVTGFPDLGSTGNRVLSLSSILPSNKNFKLYMDNYFMTLPICFELAKRQIYTLETARLNRLSGIKSIIITDDELKAKGTRAFEE